MPDIPAFNQEYAIKPPEVHYNTDFNPFKSSASVSSSQGTTGSFGHQKVEWEGLYAGLEKASRMNEPDFEQPPVEGLFGGDATGDEPVSTQTFLSKASVSVEEKSSLYLQYKGRFILTAVKSGLMLIDQHRAHVRILFDRYMNQLQQKQGVSQGVLFPEILQLPASEATMLDSILDDLAAVGFELTSLGGGSYAINGIPEGIEGLNPVELVRNMVHTAMEKGSSVKEEVQQILAVTLAREAAIVHGQVLSQDEMASLVDNLFACPSPNYTPDGKLVLTTLKQTDIEKMFK
ncbi:DNA mismatch repair protein MutL [gut metagenome]|uniref:DNA mismatch repair protein MutL n=1 Tax=gut metagenome TaxID=749906 RepID=J9GD95_9ZZZZ